MVVVLQTASTCLYLNTGMFPDRTSPYRLYKQTASVMLQVVQSLGFDVQQEFPIYADRMPTQLLAYLRLSRVQDSGEIAKVCFACKLHRSWLVLHCGLSDVV